MTVTTDSEELGEVVETEEGTEVKEGGLTAGQSEAKPEAAATVPKTEGQGLSELALGPTQLRGFRGRFVGSLSDLERFRTKVAWVDGCLVWTAATIRGWGTFSAEGGRMVPAHRWLWERTTVEDGVVVWGGGEVVRPIPDRLTLDHLCHFGAARLGLCAGGVTCPHRACVWPCHLEQVTRAVNTSRARAVRSWTRTARSARDGAHAVGRLLGPPPPVAGDPEPTGQPADGLGVRPAGLGPLQRSGDQGRLPPLTDPGAL